MKTIILLATVFILAISNLVYGFGLDSQQTTATNITGNAASANIVNVYAAQNTDASVTGTASETILYQVALPVLNANSVVKVTCLWTVTNSSNSKTLKVKLNNTAFSTVAITTNNSLFHQTVIRNRNNVALQVANANLSSTYGQTTSAVITGTENTAIALNIIVTGTLANTGETITLNSVFVEVLK